jgi:hypothetical protein
MILNTLLTRLIGRKSFRSTAPAFFGIKAIKVALTLLTNLL